MGSDKLNVKISYLIVAFDRNNITKSNVKLLLRDDFSIPYVIIDNLGGKDPLDFLKVLHEEYVEYDFDFPYKTLCGVRFVENTCEITYLITLNYVPSMNKKGRLFSFAEIQEREIEIEDYYGEYFAQSGVNFLRQVTLPPSLQ